MMRSIGEGRGREKLFIILVFKYLEDLNKIESLLGVIISVRIGISRRRFFIFFKILFKDWMKFEKGEVIFLLIKLFRYRLLIIW